MRPAPVLMQLAVCLSSLVPLTAAWPGWMVDIDSLVARADETETTGGLKHTLPVTFQD